MTDKTQPTAHAEITAPISADLRRIDGAGAQPKQQPEALRLAEILDSYVPPGGSGPISQAAAELRSQYAAITATASAALMRSQRARIAELEAPQAAPPAQTSQAAAFLITGGRTYGDGVCLSIKQAADALAVRNDGSRVEVLYAAPAQERAYICPVRTVADLVNNLLLMDQTLPIYGAQYIEHPAGRRRVITVPPTVSREMVKDSRWIGEGDELNAAVVWTRAEQPAGQEIKPLTEEQIRDLIGFGDPTEQECHLVRLGWDAAQSIEAPR